MSESSTVNNHVNDSESPQNSENLAIKYLKLNPLGLNQEIDIQRLGVFNIDILSGKPQDLFTYGTFASLDKNQFGKFDPESPATPVILFGPEDQHYRTPPSTWSSLVELSKNIIQHQEQNKEPFFPQTVRIDADGKWVEQLKQSLEQNMNNK